jgi:hypothetical protein
MSWYDMREGPEQATEGEVDSHSQGAPLGVGCL